MKEECEPIFIIGSARTGTSAVVMALRNGAHIAGYNEGHYLSMMHGMIKSAVDHIVGVKGRNSNPAVMMTYVKVDDITHDIMMMMKSRMESYFPNQKVWMDKTPDGLMLRVIPYLILMWPKARFIYTKRRALENISSRLRKFKHLSFEQNCERWAVAMDLWQKLKHHIPEGQRIEIDQRDMGLEPLKTAQRIGDFLGFSEQQIKDIGVALKGDRVEFTGGDEKAFKDMFELGWTSEQIEIYNRICAPINKEYGYSEDSSYYLTRD
jgi:hypothetical protein